VDTQLQALGIQLSDAAVRNTAGAVADKIRAVKARKQDQETIAELEAIVNDLVADKSELVRIANAYEDELVAQRLTSDQIRYISENLVPILEQLAESTTPQAEGAAAALGVLRTLLSEETVTVLQLVGFNFRVAIGEPLTALVSSYISARAARGGPGLSAARPNANPGRRR
jgi:hypothetical protein